MLLSFFWFEVELLEVKVYLFLLGYEGEGVCVGLFDVGIFFFFL